jgi:hypothetical protein
MKRVILVAALLIVVGGGAALAAGTPQLQQGVLTGGGGQTSTGTIILVGAIGQPVIGSSTNGPTTVCSGFPGCTSAAISSKVYLPIMLKNN